MTTAATTSAQGPHGPAAGAGGALEKTLRILEALAEPGGPHRLARIAATARVPKSSAFRILTALIDRGYALTDGDGRYGIGLQLRTLAAQVAGEHPEGIDEVLEFLHRSTGQTVHLALRTATGLTCVRRAGQPRHPGSRVGARLPLHTTALGKAVLAHLPVPDPRVPAPARGSVPPAELAEVRLRGWAADEQVHAPGVRCIAAPLLDPGSHPVGALSLTAAADRTTREELAACSPALLEAARGVAELLRRG
ncbi:IclR family transcriptional regulator [Streptomyces sp. NPDC097619]|uniref:IclR family transcriptional regulator n=1 Tax=Streptomyces sp. NPDC097619 TaxID=3157228 RepID=UPI0033317177